MLDYKKYTYRLRFKLDEKDNNIKKKWKELANLAQSGEHYNKNIIEKFIEKMTGILPLNYQQRVEGGFYIGDKDDNRTSLQMRFRYNRMNELMCDAFKEEKDDHIVIEQIAGKWTYDQLDIVCVGFSDFCSDYIQANRISYYIELEPHLNKNTMEKKFPVIMEKENLEEALMMYSYLYGERYGKATGKRITTTHGQKYYYNTIKPLVLQIVENVVKGKDVEEEMKEYKEHNEKYSEFILCPLNSKKVSRTVEWYDEQLEKQNKQISDCLEKIRQLKTDSKEIKE